MKKLFWSAVAMLLITSAANTLLHWLVGDVAATIFIVIAAIAFSTAVFIAGVSAAAVVGIAGFATLISFNIFSVAAATIVAVTASAVVCYNGLDYATTERLSRLRVLALLAGEAVTIVGGGLLILQSPALGALALVLGISLMAVSAFVGIPEQGNSEASHPA